MDNLANKYVSYTQFSMYQNCPLKWKLEYADNRRVYEQSIHTIFGTALHETIQNYLTVMYGHSVKAADAIDLELYLKDKLVELYSAAVKQVGDNHFSTPSQLMEFYYDGVEILRYFKRHRRVYFSSQKHKLIGVELPLTIPLTEQVGFKGFIDIVIHDERDDTYKIWDIKTSTSGWNKYQKKDKTKTAQLILYKEFYAKQYGVSPDKIDIEYFIVRRKINPDLEFAPKRVQLFSPPNGKPTRNRVIKQLDQFLEVCFDKDGQYTQRDHWPAYKSSGCKFCPYQNNEQLCPSKARKTKPDA